MTSLDAASATTAVREAAASAAAASVVLRTAPDSQISAALLAAADLLPAAADTVLAANAADVEAATSAGISPALIDRLRLDAARLSGAAQQLRELADLASPARISRVRDLPGGEGTVYERRLPVGVIGATYEARPAVTLDVAGQVLRARSAAVLRTGSAALRSSAVLVDDVLAPALAAAGLPTGAVALVRSPGHASAEALVSQPDLLPLVIVRGSGATTRHLAALGAAAGVRVLAHADGGGVLYVDASAEPTVLCDLLRAGVDRLGVCNRLNLLLIDSSRWDELSALATDELAAAGVSALLAEQVDALGHPLGHEWALDDGHEAHVTLAPVDGPAEAAALAGAQTSGIAATVCAADAGAAAAFLGAWGGTGGFWNTSTRLLDGYKLLGVPETGISVDQVPGPRGPVTSADLVLRQFVVLPPGAEPSVLAALEGTALEG